jgi:hypothetical protein
VVDCSTNRWNDGVLLHIPSGSLRRVNRRGPAQPDRVVAGQPGYGRRRGEEAALRLGVLLVLGGTALIQLGARRRRAG